MGGVIPVCTYPPFMLYTFNKVGQITCYLVDFNRLPFYA